MSVSDFSYPRWAHEELTELADRYGAPVVGVTRDPVAVRFLATINPRRRPGEVCMVVRRRSGKLLVARKTHYPPNSFRLLTGGVHRGESVHRALLRETREETSLEVETRRFLAVARYQEPDAPEPVEYATFAFLLDEVGGELRVSDPHERLEAFREVEPAELPALADHLDSLEDGPEDSPEDNLRADRLSSYRVWGRFRAPIQRLVWQALSAELAR